MHTCKSDPWIPHERTRFSESFFGASAMASRAVQYRPWMAGSLWACTYFLPLNYYVFLNCLWWSRASASDTCVQSPLELPPECLKRHVSNFLCLKRLQKCHQWNLSKVPILYPRASPEFSQGQFSAEHLALEPCCHHYLANWHTFLPTSTNAIPSFMALEVPQFMGFSVPSVWPWKKEQILRCFFHYVLVCLL